jgi:SAM-dependent methyltransferase
LLRTLVIPLAAAPAVAKGVWRNDRNGWVTEQITGLTEDETIEQLVRAFQRKVPVLTGQLLSDADPIPGADAIVSVSHVLNYLPDHAAIERALVAIARALRPLGVLAIDLCDLEWGTARRGAPPQVQVSDEWASCHRGRRLGRHRSSLVARDHEARLACRDTGGSLRSRFARWNVCWRFTPCSRRPE